MTTLIMNEGISWYGIGGPIPPCNYCIKLFGTCTQAFYAIVFIDHII